MNKINPSPNINARRKELEAELDKIKAIQEQEIINKHYPIIKSKYEGKFFKYNNGYNNDERWWMYTKIEDIKPDDVYDTGGNGVTSHFSGYSFQTDNRGQITIEREKKGYVHHVGEKISKREFIAAWNKMITEINSFK